MDDRYLQEDKVTFRQDSIDNVFSQGRKPFFVEAPAGLTVYTLTFLCFIAFIFSSLYFINLPVHLKAVGEVLAGKDYHQIIINEDNKVVSNIAIEAGVQVLEGQLLLQLDTADKISMRSEMADIDLQTLALEKQLQALKEHHSKTLGNINQQRQEQAIIVGQLSNTLVSETNILTRYTKNVANGLTSATLKDAQKRIVDLTQSSLTKEKSVFTTLNLATLNAKNLYNRETDSASAQIVRLDLKKDRILEGTQVLSPCNCVVDNVMASNGVPIIPGQSVVTLSHTRQSSSLLLFVPASHYRKIDTGSQIQVNVASYPSNKYGALRATVQSVSASPVPGNMLGKQGQGLQNVTYFIIRAVIDKVPSDVTLVTGMAVDSDIVVDNISLLNLMLNLDN